MTSKRNLDSRPKNGSHDDQRISTKASKYREPPPHPRFGGLVRCRCPSDPTGATPRSSDRSRAAAEARLRGLPPQPGVRPHADRAPGDTGRAEGGAGREARGRGMGGG